MSESGYSYVIRKPCGCIVGAVVEDAKIAAKTVADWIREGRVVERVANDEVRLRFVFGKCPHEERQLSFIESL